MSAARPAGAGGLRRDAPILLPASLLLLALLAAVTLLSYRGAVDRFAGEREQAALKLAIALADTVRASPSDDIDALARWLPAGSALAVYDARGVVRASHGFSGADPLTLPAPAAGANPAGVAGAIGAVPRVEGLAGRARETAAGAPRMRAFVPFARAGERLLLRLEIPEPTLFAQQRSLRILTPVVFGLSFAVALLAIFFLRALVRPYEALLDKARALAPADPAAGGSAFARGSDDEVELLLATFDRALAALRGIGGGGGAGAGSDAQEELSAVERALGPQLESGLLMFAADGRLLAANPAAVELLGGDAKATREAAPATAAVALAAHPALAAVVAAAIADGRSIPRASVAIERGGRSVELGLTLQALRRGGAGFLVLLADVTDLSRREAEERFAAGLAQLGELSAGVAHELRNSLATVQGYLTLAARRDLPPAAREEIAEARREAEELARVVDDFLTFARPGSGALEPVDLAALLARATSDPALAGVDVRFVPPETPLPTIAGDPHLLQRAVRNLLLNAVQATLAGAALAGRDGAVPEEGEPDVPPEPPEPPEPVIVRLLRQATGLHLADSATITIDDSGGGLAPEIAGRLFQPFASARPGGAGLGLALARRIVAMHGGTLRLEARAPRGVRAEIRLPFGNIAT